VKKITFIIIGLLIACVIAFIWKSKEKSNGYFITSETQSEEILTEFNLDKPSEDVSYILDETKLTYTEASKIPEVYAYKPDLEMDWVISLTKSNSKPFEKDEIDELFDYEWRTVYSSIIYGLSTEDNTWHYANCGDCPTSFLELQIAIDLLETYNEEKPEFSKSKLEKYVIELNNKLDSYPVNVKINISEPIENAIERAKKLVEYDKEFNQGVTIVLMDNQPYNGRKAWDALLCLGLEWGDGDLFHWTNSNRDYGPDQHFIVWTTSEPGYFLPWSIEAGEMNPKNLVFGLGIQGSVDPLEIFDAMYKSVEYCQKRLGGKILNKDLRPFDMQKEKKIIKDLIEKQKLVDQEASLNFSEIESTTHNNG
jgi:cell division protein ZipA